MDNKHFLTKIFIEQNFKKEELETILQQYQRIEFAKNDYLIEEGTTANFYYFLESGFARSYAIDLEGNDISTKFFSSTDIVIDWHSYFLRTKCRENIQAVTACVAWKINFDDFMKLFKIEAFRDVGRTRLVNNYFELKTHSVSVIADPAKDRYLNLIKDKPDIVHNVPLKQIATYLGITDTSLSRIRKEITDNR
ncbi:MAG: Crp/Fnr family transcriptional regulator [Cytophagales bacterium]|nr:Crp/Fnr family transcriptional regulator [Cytophagales bacterium]MCA6387014.1 Crp/Fnr family transcriptional regulator [Cytophagales bacterium]MCA6392048.1 Crp/Fnr family transcriptional regulator [Cytophagales bacterium]MCA6393672.1 Crp/Fnr family transcriptional regulator [Cytophagales bacterium]MCA6399429.1 Crp/Fnr family transcriptional regulator [Cytophagales bacterium]